MKALYVLISVLILAAFTSGCGAIDFVQNAETITPSQNIISETRQVNDFTGIDMATLGKVILTQGDHTSLTVKGSDNVLPEVKTTVSNGVLTIEMKKNILIESMNEENILTFTITLKNLDKLTVSGLGDVEMSTLSTSSLQLAMSGAGNIKIDDLVADSIDITVSGLGEVDVAGVSPDAKIEISGAGQVKAGDLQCKTVDVHVPGLGMATIWATDTLSGDISGAGNVNYYGSPATDIKETGLGRFDALGNK